MSNQNHQRNSSANKMLIDATHPEETRVVVLRHGRVEEFDYESAARKLLRGNIYLAKVTRVEPSLQAAFVDYGGNRHGFLAFNEIHPDYYQIPIADRRALIEAEAQAEAEEEAEIERAAQATSRRRRRPSGQRPHAGRERANDGDEDNAVDVSHLLPDEPAALDQSEHHSAGPIHDDEHHGGDRRPSEAGDVGSTFPQEATSQEAADGGSRVIAESISDAVRYSAPLTPAGRADERADERADREQHSGDADAGPGVHAESERAAEHDEAGHSHDRHGYQEHGHDEQGHDIAAHDHRHGDHEPHSHDHGHDEHRHHAHDDQAHDEAGRGDHAHTDRVSAPPDDNGANEVETIDNGNGGEAEQIETVASESEDAMEELQSRPRRRLRSYKIQEVIKRRQVILVQVVKEERGTKGAALTTYLSLAGRYTVLMPNTARGGGISRKITNAQDRKRLKAIADELEVEEGMGLIIRTAGAARTKQEIKRDYEYLLRLWESVREVTLASVAPTLVYEEGNLIKRSIRDLYGKEVDEVVVAGAVAHREAHDFMGMLMPGHEKQVIDYREPEPLFSRYQIERQLNAMFSPYVHLRSGGYLVINQTEALVSVDVNSGKSTREFSIEETAYATNLEAADEIARQLKLRDLAGLIVIDFIDMEEKRNNRAVERRLKDALRFDRARIQVGHISHFGLLEMSRQRLRTGVLEGSTTQCPHCQGTGIIRSTESVALGVLRGIEDTLMSGQPSSIIVSTTATVALYILNQKRAFITEMEARYGITIQIVSSDKVQGANFGIERVAVRNDAAVRRPERAAVSMDWGFEGEEAAEDEPAEEQAPAAATEAAADGSDNPDAPRKRRRRRGRGRRDEARGDEAQGDEPRGDRPRELEARNGNGSPVRPVDTSERSEVSEQRRWRGNGNGNGNGADRGGHDSHAHSHHDIAGGSEFGTETEAAEAQPSERPAPSVRGEGDGGEGARRGRRRGRRGGRRGGLDRGEPGSFASHGEGSPGEGSHSEVSHPIARDREPDVGEVSDDAIGGHGTVDHHVGTVAEGGWEANGHGEPSAVATDDAAPSTAHAHSTPHGDPVTAPPGSDAEHPAARAESRPRRRREVASDAASADVPEAAVAQAASSAPDDGDGAQAKIATLASEVAGTSTAYDVAPAVTAQAAVIEAPAVSPRRAPTASEPILERVVVGPHASDATVEAPSAEPRPARRGWWQRK